MISAIDANPLAERTSLTGAPQPLHQLPPQGGITMNRQYRHGDVFLHQVAELPSSATPEHVDGDVILAFGEVTGHAHRIREAARVSVWSVGAQRYLVIEGEEPVALTHEEHATIMVPPGIYESRIQRVYSPEVIRNVAD